MISFRFEKCFGFADGKFAATNSYTNIERINGTKLWICRKEREMALRALTCGSRNPVSLHRKLPSSRAVHSRICFLNHVRKQVQREHSAWTIRRQRFLRSHADCFCRLLFSGLGSAASACGKCACPESGTQSQRKREEEDDRVRGERPELQRYAVSICIRNIFPLIAVTRTRCARARGRRSAFRPAECPPRVSTDRKCCSWKRLDTRRRVCALHVLCIVCTRNR